MCVMCVCCFFFLNESKIVLYSFSVHRKLLHWNCTYEYVWQSFVVIFAPFSHAFVSACKNNVVHIFVVRRRCTWSALWDWFCIVCIDFCFSFIFRNERKCNTNDIELVFTSNAHCDEIKRCADARTQNALAMDSHIQCMPHTAHTRFRFWTCNYYACIYLFFGFFRTGFLFHLVVDDVFNAQVLSYACYAKKWIHTRARTHTHAKSSLFFAFAQWFPC